MHISCSYDMSYVITFDIWEVRIMSNYHLGQEYFITIQILDRFMAKLYKAGL